MGLEVLTTILIDVLLVEGFKIDVLNGVAKKRLKQRHWRSIQTFRCRVFQSAPELVPTLRRLHPPTLRPGHRHYPWIHGWWVLLQHHIHPTVQTPSDRIIPRVCLSFQPIPMLRRFIRHHQHRILSVHFLRMLKRYWMKPIRTMLSPSLIYVSKRKSTWVQSSERKVTRKRSWYGLKAFENITFHRDPFRNYLYTKRKRERIFCCSAHFCFCFSIHIYVYIWFDELAMYSNRWPIVSLTICLVREKSKFTWWYNCWQTSSSFLSLRRARSLALVSTNSC